MEGPEGGVSTVDIARILWRRRWVLMTVAACGLLGTAAAISFTPRSYQAQAVVLIEPRLEPAPDGSGAVVPILPDSATIDSLAQVLSSRSVADDVIGDLALADDPELRPKPAGGTALADILRDNSSVEPAAGPASDRGLTDRFLGKLEVQRAGKSNVLAIIYNSSEPEKAASVANSVARHFVSERQAMRDEAAHRASAALRERLQSLEQRLDASTSTLGQAKAAASSGTPEFASLADELSGLRRELVAAGADRAGREAKLARIQRNGLTAADDTRGSAFLESLEEQKAEVLRREAETTAEYGQRHPKLLDVRAERADIEGRVMAERRAVIGQVADEVASARAKEQALVDAMTQLETRAANDARRRAELQGLEQRVELDRRLYESQLARVRAANSVAATPDARVISEATVPMVAEFPKPAIMLLVGLTSSVLVGLFAVYAAEQTDQRLRTPEDVRAALGLPTLGLLPQLARRALREAPAHDWSVDRPASCEAEALRTVLMGIDPRRHEDGARVVLITSAVPGEGKSTLALGLARIAAAEGLRVLLIDADLRRPRIAHMLGRDAALGLAVFAAERASLADVLIQDSRSPLRVIPGSADAGPPTGLLGETGVPAVLKAARAAYDLVLVDTAPLLPVADAARLALSANRILLVARWGRTDTALATQAVHQLGVARERLAGVVLSRVDLRRHRQWAKADVGVAYGRYRSYYVT